MINIEDCTHRKLAEEWALFFLGCTAVDKETVGRLLCVALEQHPKNDADPEHDECGFPVPNTFTREHRERVRRLLVQCINKAIAAGIREHRSWDHLHK